MDRQRHILPIIVISQFFCTSLWFAGNAVMSDLTISFDLSESALGHITSAVQFGFISGTLVFAMLSIADRFSPSKVFLLSAIFGALFNLGLVWEGNNLTSILVFRFLTGFFLAGIYPVGMKIAADYFQKGLGISLGFLVGALVLGTALPHLLKDFTSSFPWQGVLFMTSGLATLGGLLMVFLVPDGPHRKASQEVQWSACFKIFGESNFRSAALGYFGHMWELYAFWAFVPTMLITYVKLHQAVDLSVSMASFSIIAIGGLACVLGGYIARRNGVKRVAFFALLFSCLCCLFSPLIFAQDSVHLFIGFLLFWGMVVIADSPLFSTLVAQNAPIQLKGTALTIVNSIGFFITILSIQLINSLMVITESTAIYSLLAVGPVLGLIALGKNKTGF